MNLEILNHSQDFFYLKDRARRFQFANRGMLEFWGCRGMADVLGKTDFDFVPDYLAERYEREDARVLDRGERVVNKVEILTRNGHESSWHVTTKLPVYDAAGEVVALFGCTRNLNEKRLKLLASEPVADVLTVLEERFSEDLRVPELAKLSGLSVSALERRFKKTMGTTLVSYLRHVRLNEACKLLVESDDSLAEIAYRCGYCDQSYFTTEFSRSIGTTPLKYRKRHI